MRVARDRSAALDLALQLTEAAQELMVELLLLKQFPGLTRERLLGPGEFFGERGDDGLWRTDGSRLQLFDPVDEAVDEADDGINSLRVHLADVSLAE